jgi:hypothetical protein
MRLSGTNKKKNVAVRHESLGFLVLVLSWLVMSYGYTLTVKRTNLKGDTAEKERTYFKEFTAEYIMRRRKISEDVVEEDNCDEMEDGVQCERFIRGWRGDEERIARRVVGWGKEEKDGEEAIM